MDASSSAPGKRRQTLMTSSCQRTILPVVLFLFISKMPPLQAFSSNRLPLTTFSFNQKGYLQPVTASLAAFVGYDSPPGGNTNSSEQNAKQNDRKMRKIRHQWLQKVSKGLLETTPGTLNKGKWHEIISMLTAWTSFAQDDSSAPLVMECLLKRLVDERRAGNKEVFVTTELYNTVIEAWYKQASPSKEGKLSARRARDILLSLQRSYIETQDETTMPDAKSFIIVLHALSKAEDAAGSKNMLKWMEKLHENGLNNAAKLTLTAYAHALNAIASTGSKDAGIEAERLLKDMNATGVEPTTLCYTTVMKAWIKVGRLTRNGRQAAEHSERIMDEMHTKPDAYAYTTVINAWAQSGQKDFAAERAQEILNRLENDPNVQSDIHAYTACMSAWVKSYNPKAVDQIEALMERMESLDHVEINLMAYNTYIHALAVHGSTRGMPKKANDLLDSLEQRFQTGQINFAPNIFSYNLVLEAWARSSEESAAVRAMEVFRNLLKTERVRPDRFSFNQVLVSFSRSSIAGSARQAEQILKYMKDAFETGIINDRPGSLEYSAVIASHARIGEPGSAQRAEQLLAYLEMKTAAGDDHFKPNLVAFNDVIDAWARSGEGTLAARKAEALLARLRFLVEAGDETMQPNIVTYNRLLQCWAHSGTRCCAIKAEEYLNQMWNLYESGNERVLPDEKSYNTVIKAISKSQNKGKAQQALRVLRKMDKLYRAGYKTKPSRITYNAVLQSCALPAQLDQRAKRKALDTAIFTFEELKNSEYGKPTHVTYRMFLQAINSLLPKGDVLRRQVIAPVFLQACKDGQVDNMVLAELRDAAPGDLYRELLAGVSSSRGNQITKRDLPHEWTCNVETSRKFQAKDHQLQKDVNRARLAP